MKFKTQKEQPNLQSLIDRQNEIEGEIQQLQNQIDELETIYLQRTWPDGNVYIGWNRSTPVNNGANNQIKINITSKEKLFSLSSISSVAFKQLGQTADRQLSPYGQHRFQSKKKKRSKKRNTSQMRRPRPIRRKKRR